MKKIYILLIALVIFLTSCFEQEIVPPLTFEGEANMKIAELQQLHTLGTGTPTSIDTNAIITGIVISTDEFGSAYRELYIQDETGGICLRFSNTAYFNQYRIGQRVFVIAKGLHLGNYVSGDRFGFYQLGLFGNTTTGFQRISLVYESRHIFPDGIPGSRPNPTVITNTADINKGIGGDYHTLVRLEDCYFQAANGSTRYFEKSGTSTTISRVISFNNGTGTVEARISEYAAFANEILPTGPLNITGILTMFGDANSSTPQLIICDTKDVEAIAPPKILVDYDMKTNPFNEGWQNVQKAGTNSWTYENQSVRVLTPTQETECWFVSPKFNFAGEKEVTLTFSYRLQSGNSENLQALYTINGNDWVPLSFVVQPGAITEATINLNDDIATNPNLQIKFKYKTTTIFPMCAIYNVTFKANATN